MKTNIKITLALASFVATVALFSPLGANAQKYAVKAYGDVGLGSAMSLATDLPEMSATSSSNAFGVDFGYTFWQKNANRLEVNIGIGYRAASSDFNLPGYSFNYAAPATADEDGNPYQRFTTLSGVEQKVDLGYFNIPIYLQYQYRVSKWLGVHTDFGFGLGSKCLGKVVSTKGRVKSYGVYPEYGDLIIDADYLNDFGQRDLAEAKVGDAEIKSLSASIIAGAGLEFYVWSLVSIDLGIRYNAGLTNVFGNRYGAGASSIMTSENAPVTYTTAQGQQIKALSDYVTNSHLNPFSLHIGVSVRF